VHYYSYIATHAVYTKLGGEYLQGLKRQNKINMNYPEIYYPYFYQEIAESEPELKKPVVPCKPMIPGIPQIEKDENTGCLFVPFILIVLAFLLIDIMNFKIVASFFVLSLISVGLYMSGKKDKQLYYKKLKEYENAKRDYTRKIQIYESQILKYQENVAQYHKSVIKSLKKKKLRTYRNNLYNNLYQGESVDFEFCNDDEDVLRGKSESFFYKYLKKIEGVKVWRSSKLPVGEAYYYPDFLIVVKSHEFYIDLEIDEPYEMHGRVPIHYEIIDEYGDIGSIDFNRNEYFTDCGWFVIRFAEEQVVSAPNECIDFIKQFIDKITSFSLEEPCMLFEIDKWTEEDAEILALEKYRLGYLNQITNQKTKLWDLNNAVEFIPDIFENDYEPIICMGADFESFFVTIFDGNISMQIPFIKGVIESDDIYIVDEMLNYNQTAYIISDIEAFFEAVEAETIRILEVMALRDDEEYNITKEETVLRAELV